MHESLSVQASRPYIFTPYVQHPISPAAWPTSFPQAVPNLLKFQMHIPVEQIELTSDESPWPSLPFPSSNAAQTSLARLPKPSS